MEHKKMKRQNICRLAGCALLFLLICASHANYAPIGYFDGIIGGQTAYGWALDPDNASREIIVHLYVDGPAGQGRFAGSITADQPRPDVNQVTGYAGDHGFSLTIPDEYRNAYRIFYAYGIDSGGGSNSQLTGTHTIGTKPSGDSQISASVGGSSLVIRTTARLAGAIGSLTWKGKEFINNYDHGRELQSASSYDGFGECFNPTEAGSGHDGTGSGTTSELQALSASGNVLSTQTRMAYWLRPGETSPYCGSAPSARNNYSVSNHILNKKVTIGFQGMPHVIEYLINFTVSEHHNSATFEALTGYMTPEFSKFWTYDPTTKALSALSDGPGEQINPVILATPDGNYAMGIFSPDLPQWPGTNLGYGRWRFPASQYPGTGNACVKWNCVYRISDVYPGIYSFRCYPIVGTLSDVTSSIDRLYEYFDSFKNHQPMGNFDSVSNSGTAYGWALDQDNATQSIAVHFYADGTAGTGEFMGATTANVPRPDVNNATGYPGNHGYAYAIPDKYRNGIQHTIYAYAIDSAGGTNPLLSGSPKTFNATTTTTTTTSTTLATTSTTIGRTSSTTTTTSSPATTSTSTTTTSTTTSSTIASSTTTTTVIDCPLEGDYPPCGEVSMGEVIDMINRWIEGNAFLPDVIDLINEWARE